jgi:peptidoglycan/LPS O-acetylase OafA/YrhL
VVTGSSTAGQRLSRDETCFVRILAIVLIAHSHLDHLYPLPQIAVGGAIGNSLFFMVSGYGLAASYREYKRSFSLWYRRKIMRIYPSVLLVTLMDFLLNKSWRDWGVTDYAMALTWPTLFWFVAAIMLFYPLFFVVMRCEDNRAFIGGIVLLSVLYIGWYFFFVDVSAYTIEGPGYFKWIFYLQIMLFGGYLAAGQVRIPQGTAKHLFLLCAFLIGYFGVILAVRAGFGEIQALIHVLTLPIVYLVLVLSKSTFVTRNILMRKHGKFLVSTIGGLSLEIYLLQYMVYSNYIVRALSFPVNITVFWCIVVILSLMVSKASSLARQLIQKDEQSTALIY